MKRMKVACDEGSDLIYKLLKKKYSFKLFFELLGSVRGFKFYEMVDFSAVTRGALHGLKGYISNPLIPDLGRTSGGRVMLLLLWAWASSFDFFLEECRMPILFRHRLAAMIGNILEHYDNVLFGLLVPFIAPLFFPHSDPLTALILTYGMLPLGILMRPLGSLFFGWMGDRWGRTRALFF